MVAIKPFGISVIVCCYNSAKLLPLTLQYLAKQKFCKIKAPWEVILVDNASKDDTSQVARSEWDKYNLDIPLHIYHQPRPGLSYARDLGISHANYEFLLFCDDDNWLSENYIELAFESMSTNEMISALGGCGKEVCELTPPSWFPALKAAYALEGQASSKYGEISRLRGFIYAAGAVFRYSDIRKIQESGFEKLATGRKGKSLSSGEDVELCYALLLNGKKIYYDERLQFQHYLTESRLNWPYFKRMSKGFGAAFPFLMPYKILINKESSRFRLGINWLYISAFYLLSRTLFFELPLSLFCGNYHRVRSNLSSHSGFLLGLLSHHSKVKGIYKSLPNAPWVIEEYKILVQQNNN